MKNIGVKKRIGVFFVLCFIALFSISPSICVAKNATNEGTVLKVAYYPLDGFFQYDKNGKEEGYGVELLNKISQYTGIKFKYVKADSWESTKKMLLSGKADIRMPGTKSAESSSTLSYNESSILDTYDVILALKDRDDLYYQDYNKFKNLRIACTKSYYDANSIGKHLKKIGIKESQIVYYEEYNDCYNALIEKKVDALLTNVMDMDDNVKMIDRFNSVSNYINMPKGNDKLSIIDDAVAQIKLDEPLFFSSLYEKWFSDRTTIPLTYEESEYLKSIKSITFAYQTDEGYLSHVEDGKYYGIYVEMGKEICRRLGVTYKETSATDSLSGKTSTNVYAGFFYDYNYAKKFNFALSCPVRDISYFIIQKKEHNFDKKTCTIAAIKKFKYTSTYIKTQYKDADFLYCDSYEKCLKAVENGSADMTIINNYIAEYYLEMHQFNDLSVQLSNEYSHLFCFAAANNDEKMASVLTKAISSINEEDMGRIYILGQKQKPETKFLQSIFYKNPVAATAILCIIVVIFVVMILLIYMGRKRKKQNEELEEAISIKRDFLAKMSHDMRTPMNGIIGLSYIMEDEDDLGAIKNDILKLRDSGQYLLQLINDVLDMNKIEGGNLKLHDKVCDEEKIFKNICDMMAPIAKQKNIEFNIKRRNIEWKYMKIDEQRVKQIFINLINNSIKFTPEGGRIDFEMELVSEKDNIIRDKFIIRDTGIGISEKFIDDVFEPFKQENKITEMGNTGSGLGMTIVKQLVELMGGSISLSSKENVGTEVTLYLNFPLAEKIDDEIPENKTIVLPEGLNILMCEDHPLNGQISIKLLEKVKANVTWVKNGKEGLDIFSKSEKGDFDLILMDIRMPVMDGLEAAREIRKLNREDAKTIPIIAMTANTYEEDVQKTMKAGMNAHLAKPIEPSELYKCIKMNL